MIRQILTAAALACVVSTAPLPASTEPIAASPTNAAIETAREALELHYIKRKIFSPVRCLSKPVGADTFVRCVPAPCDRQGAAGGL